VGGTFPFRGSFVWSLEEWEKYEVDAITSSRMRGKAAFEQSWYRDLTKIPHRRKFLIKRVEETRVEGFVIRGAKSDAKTAAG
jgi:hypothetical protein